MKLKLKNLIKEEIRNVLKEGFQGDNDNGDGYSGFRGSAHANYNPKELNHAVVSHLLLNILKGIKETSSISNLERLSNIIIAKLISQKKIGFFDKSK
jgi:hypothetical protein